MAAMYSKNIVIENGKAVGVTARGPDGQNCIFFAKDKIIVACGVLKVPSS